MNRDDWWEYFSRYGGRVLGVIAAIFIFIILTYCWWLILLLVFIYIGYFVGKNIDYGGNFKNIKSIFKWRR